MDYNQEIPFFSIIIPIWNVNLDYFAICMNSILKQSYGRFEVILVDDGSKTECAKAIDGYSQKDKRVNVIHQENQGVSAARNHGLETAKADWILFVDADDWLENNALEVLKGYLEKVDCDILLFNVVKEYGERHVKLNYGLKNETLYKMEDVDVLEMLYCRVMGAPNTKAGKLSVIYYSPDKVISRRFLIANSIRYPVGIQKSEDKIFFSSCFEKMRSLYYIDSVFYHYRIHSESVCNRYSEHIDSNSVILALKLQEIAKRLDQEIGEKKHDKSYNGITKQFYRFTFGIISDIFRLKYFHPDYPGSSHDRKSELKKFLNMEPFRLSIINVKYSDLSLKAKLKKLILLHGMPSLFYKLKVFYDRLRLFYV